MGRGSVQLVRVFGIRVGVDASWFVVLFLIIYLLSGTFREVFPGRQTLAFALAVAASLLFFASVVLHELGHAVVAVRNGIRIAGIDLWLFGGVARMSREADSPGADFRIAVAGPVVTLVVAIVCAAAGLALADPRTFASALVLSTTSGAGPVVTVLAYLTFVNAALLLFNLLPGLPLDGGRIARALAWKLTGDRTRATQIAATLGRGFAIVLAGLGIFLVAQYEALVAGLWLVLIAFFIFQAARASVTQSRATARLVGLRVADVMDRDPVALPAETSLEEALDAFFLRYRWPWFPVIDAEQRFVGLLTRERIDAALDEGRSGAADGQAPIVGDVLEGRTVSRAERVDEDEPVEAVLGSEVLQRLGALVAVDEEGRLRGIVTLDRVRRALKAGAPS